MIHFSNQFKREELKQRLVRIETFKILSPQVAPLKHNNASPQQATVSLNSMRNPKSDQLSMPIPKEGACSTNKTLLLLNSGVWDLLEDGSINREKYRCQAKELNSRSRTCCDYDTEFSDHIQSLRELLSSIQETYPNVTIGWKSMTAVHVHNAICEQKKLCRSRVKYMSSSRADTIFWKQKELIEKEFPNVLFADVYNLTRSRGHQGKPNDGRHYIEIVTNLMWTEVFGKVG